MSGLYKFSLLVLLTITYCSGNKEDMWRLSVKVWQECNKINENTAECLQTKLISAVDRAARAENIPLSDNITFIRKTNINRANFGRALSENDLNEAKKQGTLPELLWDGVGKFLSSHTVKIDLPEVNGEDIKKGMEEGRGKMKKMMGMMMMGGAMKAMAIIPIAIVILFLLAGKAFIIAKIAFVLSLLVTIKKLLASKNDDHGGSWQSSGWQSHGGGWDRRALDSHNLVYSAYSN